MFTQSKIYFWLPLFLVISACGGGGGGGDIETPQSIDTPNEDNSSKPDETENITPIDDSPPPPPKKIDYSSLPLPDEKAARRFLTRATFGPIQKDVDYLMDYGYVKWIDEQISKEPSLHLDLLRKLMLEDSISENNNCTDAKKIQRLRDDAWWENTLHGEDQLRQRIAFAFSQIIVISKNDDGLICQARGMASFYDVFVLESFNNYLGILEQITFHPAMGAYLSTLFNEKVRTEKNIQPDENFAREVMQLFTIGLHELNDDGSQKKDRFGHNIETYNQENITTLAKVFTGLHYGDTFNKTRKIDSETTKMRVLITRHDSSEKILFNETTIPAESNPTSEIEATIKNLFAHKNTAPFLSKQLIQRLVTSNPSPGYVQRVTNVFNDNGLGGKGDLSAIIKAILLDKEALNGHSEIPNIFGKLKEPLLRLSGLWRAYDAKGEGGRFRFTQSDIIMGQKALAAHSVFNFYSPNYSPPGTLREQKKVAPEFEILNSQTITTTTNVLRDYVNGAQFDSINRNTVTLDLTILKSLATTPALLVEKLNMDLMTGSMSDKMKTTLIGFITRMKNDDPEFRAKEALFLVVSSPEYAIQR